MKGANGSNKQEVDAFGTNHVNKPYFQEVANSPNLEAEAMVADKVTEGAEPHKCETNV